MPPVLLIHRARDPPFGALREHPALFGWRVQNNPFWSMSN